MSKNIILYHAPRSRSGRVKLLLDLLELDYETRLIDTAAGENKTTDYLALHPFGRVPTLIHNDRVIIESGAQMMYLADLVPDKGLAPKIGTLDRATYYEWFVLQASMLEPLAVARITDPTNPATAEGMALVQRVMADRVKMPFCLGEQFTAVDVLVHWGLRMVLEVDPKNASPKLRDYYESLRGKLDWSAY